MAVCQIFIGLSVYNLARSFLRRHDQARQSGNFGTRSLIHVAPLQRSSNLSPSTVTLKVCVREIAMFYRLSLALVSRVGGHFGPALSVVTLVDGVTILT